MRELNVVGVRVELPANQPIVLLTESEGERYVPIWIGSVEATAIAYEQQGIKPPRPMTHDLLVNVVAALGSNLERVRITGMKDGLYFAELDFPGVDPVSARPSDAIAIALRTGAPIFADDDLLDEVGITIDEATNTNNGEGSEDEVEKFREFLDNVSPDDFAGS
ncbi:hypothetical protein CLV47_114107 [Antricoccus suffuscus]|uniref:BFN domain-containing protein n=1 Tax=Antricoccus suffuscus TaxID=1629062 RepID=A0A2T0ZWS3_9ACTN|nr:bifunctional nuclease family protein [Antricoccus suffuscus]PRZ40809.1 hypothetical protein CLV47_114107 [Antricoccus suffuscus]